MARPPRHSYGTRANRRKMENLGAS